MTDTTSDFLPGDDELLSAIDAESADIMSIPSANTIEGDAAFLAKFSGPQTMSALAPEDREVVRERLKAFPPLIWATKEPELVQQVIAEKARTIRVQQGPGESANALTRARWELGRQALDLDKAAGRIVDELAATDGYDPDTGAPLFVIPLESPRRRAMDAELVRIHTLSDNIRSGREGQERLAEARQKALADAKARLTDAHVAAETKRRAEANAIEERIAQGAESIGKRMKSYSI